MDKPSRLRQLKIIMMHTPLSSLTLLKIMLSHAALAAIALQLQLAIEGSGRGANQLKSLKINFAPR